MFSNAHYAVDAGGQVDLKDGWVGPFAGTVSLKLERIQGTAGLAVDDDRRRRCFRDCFGKAACPCVSARPTPGGCRYERGRPLKTDMGWSETAKSLVRTLKLFFGALLDDAVQNVGGAGQQGDAS